ncbi:UNVERIFIED_ORG: hypothetical protein GGE63_003488 [Rhizobium esperanzae]
MNEVMAENQLSLVIELIRIGEIAGQRGVVVPQRRRQEHRPLSVDR